jgi:nitrite reductase/ring-hydroxylating ferredoxin subunit
MKLPQHVPSGSTVHHGESTPAGCTECTGRRTFLLDAIGAAMALAGVSMMSAVGELHALEPRVARGAVRYPIPTADGVQIDKKNDTILCRVQSRVIAFSLACPHQNTELRAMPGSKGFQCPKHKSRYQPDGTFISGRATRNMDRLPISRDGDAIVVDPDVAYRSDKDAAKWAAAVVKL